MLNYHDDQDPATSAEVQPKDSNVNSEIMVPATGTTMNQSSMKRNRSAGDFRRQVQFVKMPEIIPGGGTTISERTNKCSPKRHRIDMCRDSPPSRRSNRPTPGQEKRKLSPSPIGRSSQSPSAGRRPRNPVRSRRSFRSHSPRDSKPVLLRANASSSSLSIANSSAHSDGRSRAASSLSPKMLPDMEGLLRITSRKGAPHTYHTTSIRGNKEEILLHLPDAAWELEG